MVISGPRKQEATFGVTAAGFVTLFDWLVVRQQSCAPGILCSVWSHHPHLGGGAKTLLCIFLWVGTGTLSGGCTNLWLFLLFLYPLLSLISNCLNPRFGTQGRSRRLNDAYILQTRNGEHRTDLYSRAPQSSTQFGTPLQYSCLENPMDGGAWWAAVHGVARVGHDWVTSLSIFTFHFAALEKETATHSSVLAWRIPGTGEPGGLPSMGSHRVGHDWSNLAAAAAAGNYDCDNFLSKWSIRLPQLGV